MKASQKVYLAFGGIDSGKAQLAKIFNRNSVSIDDNQRIDDHVIVHRFQDEALAIIDCLSYDAMLWSDSTSAMTAANGIAQFMKTSCRDNVDGVLLFESLDSDYSGIGRTIAQAKAVLAPLGARLTNDGVLSVFTGLSAGHSFEEFKATLRDKGLENHVALENAKEDVYDLQEMGLVLPRTPANVFEVPLYNTVAHVFTAEESSIENDGYVHARTVHCDSMINRGVAILTATLSSTNVLNFGIVKTSGSEGSISNYGSWIGQQTKVSKVFNKGTFNSTTID